MLQYFTDILNELHLRIKAERQIIQDFVEKQQFATVSFHDAIITGLIIAEAITTKALQQAVRDERRMQDDLK